MNLNVCIRGSLGTVSAGPAGEVPVFAANVIERPVAFTDFVSFADGLPEKKRGGGPGPVARTSAKRNIRLCFAMFY